MHTEFILASKSPRRIEFLRNMGIDFVSIPSNIVEDETNIYPPFIPLTFAQLKAEEIANKYPEQFTMGVDTIVCLNGKIYGKPKNIEEAEQFLLELSGKKHQVITGVCIIQKNSNIKCSFTESSNVIFKDIDLNIIRKYFKKTNPLDKAGAYAIQENSELIIEKYEGSFNNIIGLPTEKLLKTLNILNINHIY